MSSTWSEQFEGLLRAHLPLLADDAELVPDVALTQYGLDSLGTVGVLVELEGTFDITVPDEALTAETFATAGSLWATIDGQLATRP